MSSAVADTSVGLTSNTLPPVASAERMYKGSTFPEQGQPVWGLGSFTCAARRKRCAQDEGNARADLSSI